MKKFLSFLLSLSLTLCVLSINVSASEEVTFTSSEICNLSLQNTSAELRGKLTDVGVMLKENSELQLVPLSTTDTRSIGKALIITNQVGENFVKDIIVPVSDNTIGFNTSELTRSNSYTSDDTELGWDDKILIRGTVNYDKYVPSPGGRAYYRPINASYTYQLETPTSGATVAYLEMLYSCAGPVFSYPGFEDLGFEYDKIIRVYSTFPIESRTYSMNDPFTSDRVISPTYSVNGHTMTFNTRIDGQESGITVRIFD